MRMRSESPIAKQKILEAARELMLKKGFASTSIDDICKKIKLTKGCFFHYFKTKEELAKAVLDGFCCAVQEKIEFQCCSAKEKDPLKRVYHHIDCLMKMARTEDLSKGCLLGQLAQELSDTNFQLRQLCCEAFEHWAKRFERDLKEAKEKYIPKSDLNPSKMSQYFVAVVEGSMLLSKVHRQPNIFVSNMEFFRNYIQKCFIKNKKGGKYE